MILILRATSKSIWLVLTVLIAGALFGSAPSVMAQGSLSLSVTPTLFEMSATPGQFWQSSVRVINTNDYPLTVYLEAVNFAPQGEGGTGKFLPVFEEFTEGTTLAEWIEISTDSITIPPEQSRNVSFTVSLPEDVSPGGHFAAIMVGTKPPQDDTSTLQVKTAQVVTSLFFVRVAGDVVESGSIREFRVVKGFLSEPTVDFELRFENRGNVHLQPQGEITIYNMWGKERGVIPINHQTHFGNVLPESIRKFRFNWTGEWSFSEIGRYSAVATLGYGEEGKQFVSSRTYFWVIPLKEVAITLGLIVAVFLFATWVIRRYVRRMLMMAGVDPEARQYRGRGPQAYDPEAVRVDRYKSFTAPVSAGVDDFKERIGGVKRVGELFSTVWSLIITYKLFFLSAVVFIIFFVLIVWYVRDAKTDDRAYEVVIENPDTSVRLSSEEVLYEELAPASDPVANVTTASTSSSTPPISLVNRSGVSGVAAAYKLELTKEGYQVGDISAELKDATERTVIVYNQDLADTALNLSRLLNGALLSARPEVDQDDPIVIFLGQDAVKKRDSD